MSEVAADSRGGRETRGNGGPRGGQPGGLQQNSTASSEGFSGSGHAQQDFSWQVGQQQQRQMEAYNNFYYTGPAAAAAAGAGYSPFSGDIRDSIAAIWSRTSPSGEGFAAASGGYGQGGEGFAAAAAGQFAANLNFAPTSELSMFGAAAAGAGDYSAAYGQYGFGPQYTQWPDNGGNAGGNGTAAGGNNAGSRGGYSYLSGGREPAGGLMDVQHGLEGMKLNSRKESNGGVKQASGGSSKLSWASVASQPAKPQPVPKTAKKPGVLPPPSIIPSLSKPPVPQQTPTEKMMNSPQLQQAGVPQQQQQQQQMMVPPPPQASHQPMPPQVQQQPLNMPPVMNNHHDAVGFPRGPPPNMSPHQGRSNHIMTNGPPPPRVNNRGPQTNGTNGGGPKMIMPSSVTPSAVSHPVLDNLRSINDYNPKSFDMSPKNARYFVIKSFSEDDIHRSIKYEIWCSTDHGNKRLDAAYKAQNGQGPIFLFFSVNGSGHFCGMAEMLSAVDYSNTGSSVWVQDKFKGQFKVKWIYVKDVPNGQLRHIRLENNENKPVTNSRDTQEVPPEKGKMVLKIIHGYKHSTSLFDDFVHYEKKQEEEDNKKKQQISDHHGGGGHHRGERGEHGGHHREHHQREQRGGGDHQDERGGHRPRRGGENNRKPPRH